MWAIYSQFSKNFARNKCSIPRRKNGFTLIEILVVMVIIGLLAGVALPRLFAISQRYEIAAQRKSLLTEIGNLGYRAYSSGRSLELTSTGTSTANASPIVVPHRWRLEVPQPIHYSFNGICGGGVVILTGPDGTQEEIHLAPPLCRPVDNRGRQ